MTNPGNSQQILDARAIKALVNELTTLRQRVDTLDKGVRTAQTDRVAVMGGQQLYYDGTGKLRTIQGAQTDGTYTTVDGGGAPHPAPTAPILAPVSGGYTVTWDGKFVDNSPLLADWMRVDVHVSDTAGFTISIDNIATAIVVPKGAMVTVDSESLALQYVKLVAVNTSGENSTPSAEVSVLPLPTVVDANDMLVRASIMSPDYVEGQQHGWRIKQDGTAEFNNVESYGRAHGPVAAYDAMSASTSFSYRGNELQTMLDGQSGAVLAWGQKAELSASSSGGTVVPTYVMAARMPVPVRRMQHVNLDFNLYKNATVGTVRVDLRYAYGAAATIYSPVADSVILDVGEVIGYHSRSIDLTFPADPGSGDTTSTYISWLITICATGCGAQFSVIGGYGPSVSMSVHDAGPIIADTFGDTRVQHTFDIAATAGAQYDGAHHAYADSVYWSGNGFDAVGNRKSFIWFDPTTLNELIGVNVADIDYVQVYLHCASKNYTSDERLGFHNVTGSPPLTEPGATFSQINVPMYAGLGTWVDIPITSGSPILTALRGGVFSGITLGDTFSAFPYFATYYNDFRIRASFRAP